MGAKIKN
jgi:hypothetical protein